MAYYDLCLTWGWQYDADFIGLLDSACQSCGLSVIQVTPSSLERDKAALECGELGFGAFLDRTEHEAAFAPFSIWAREHGCFRPNPKEAADWAEDKANIHPELIKAGLETPLTIILPAWNDQPSLPEIDLSPLGDCFVIKPSYGGGGEGVVMGATTLDQVMSRRMEYPHLKYLLQQTITAQTLDGRPAWFRVIYCDGKPIPCWWDPASHVYGEVSPEEESRYGLSALRDITLCIAGLCGLSFFSTEIAQDHQQRWVVIDYVNDQIDMRLQSQAADGVPDAVVQKVSLELARMIEREYKHTKGREQ